MRWNASEYAFQLVAMPTVCLWRCVPDFFSRRWVDGTFTWSFVFRGLSVTLPLWCHTLEPKQTLKQLLWCVLSAWVCIYFVHVFSPARLKSSWTWPVDQLYQMTHKGSLKRQKIKQMAQWMNKFPPKWRILLDKKIICNSLQLSPHFILILQYIS